MPDGMTTGSSLAADMLQGIGPGWRVFRDVRLLRLGRHMDAVLVSDRAVVVLRVADRGFRDGDRAAVEDAALDLADFHAGCRDAPVLPVVVVPNGAHASGIRPLPLPGVSSVIETTRLLLPGLLREVLARYPGAGIDPATWSAAAYRPVPALLEAACLMYRRHDVVALTLARAGRTDLAATIAAARSAIGAPGHRVVFVTGAPGAGKTLCGLDLAFTPGDGGAAFLTGNPTLVHVLREALARDAAHRGADRRAARHRMRGVVQALPAFRDHYLATADPPPERVVVIDEAQRCWTRDHAVAKTLKRAIPLTESEPGHLLDIMGRHPSAAIICLIGGGQEIHAGEGGLATWGEALAARPYWHVSAPPDPAMDDPRQRLGLPGALAIPALHLPIAARSIHAPSLTAWVAAVLANDAAAAIAIARAWDAPPIRITRSLPAMRQALRSRGQRQAGLVASSGARRLRAEGLGSTLDHQDEDAVAQWFLHRWPDIRSADALETAATEFSIQGLELDYVGVCWDADLVHRGAWLARKFRGTAWTALHRADDGSNRVNAYRVLLTRARHATVIWIPRGDARDPTRSPTDYDATAAFLERCGAPPLDEAASVRDDPAVPQAPLL